MPDWHGGLCHGAPLGAAVDRIRPRGQADAAALREALREARQERCCGRGGHLRGGHSTDHALRLREGHGAAKRLDASPDAAVAGSPADHGDQREESIAALCRHEGIAEGLYYSWSKEFLEAGKKRLAGDTARQATSNEVKTLRAEARNLKEALAEQMLENRHLKKSMIGDGGDEE